MDVQASKDVCLEELSSQELGALGSCSRNETPASVSFQSRFVVPFLNDIRPKVHHAINFNPCVPHEH
jgi:hypothetical protein